MKLENRLILNKYLLSLFGVERFASIENSNLFNNKTLRDVLINSHEGFNEEGKSYFMSNLIANLEIEDNLLNNLETYDQNIKSYLDHINTKRDNPIILKYFQYLAVLFTEIYLDRYFNHRDKFLNNLNSFIDKENKKVKKEKERYSHFNESDLHKLAYYMATGSGKTLIMHINYLQYLNYTDREIDNIILVTPNSGLSQQHIKEFRLSNIESDLFINLKGSMFNKGQIEVIEITKLVETKTGEGDSEEVGSFEGHNLVLVDEGHRGSGGDVWKDNREMLARDGFIFEYSATFGQAVGSRVDRSEKWDNETDYLNKKVNEIGLDENVRDEIFNINKNKTYINMSLFQLEKKMKEYNLLEIQQERIKSLYNNLLEEYSKAIIFDYSYKFFYEDGYGKDYDILNLKESQLKEYNNNFLLANLVSFYEQKLLYQDEEQELAEYNLENPLLLFVGHTVSASGSLTIDDKTSISDVEFVIQFLNNFLNNRTDIINSIDDIIYNHSFKDKDGQDVFAGRFSYLKEKDLSAEDIYNDLLLKVFNTSSIGSANLELYEIKNAEGEIGLKLKGKDYFALINIGDVSRLTKRLEKAGITILEDNFSDSFFTRINSHNSDINILIGSRKFTEGWNSYRVSSIGLLNIGRSEGSQIIQLFGRGVRLKGLNNSLQRSTVFTDRDHPAFIKLLETLNIFGIKADYMEKFREYLEKEGIDTAGYEEIDLPIKPDKQFLGNDLLTIKLEEGYNFQDDRFIQLEVDKDIDVTIDLRPKLEQLSSSSKQEEDELTVEQKYYLDEVEKDIFNYVDWDKLYLEMINYKKQRQFSNLLIKKELLKEIIENKLYTLYCNKSTLAVNSFAKLAEIEDIIIKILKKYISQFYQSQRLAYENTHLKYTPLSREDGNFQDYVVKVEKKNKKLIKEIKNLIDKKDEIYDQRLKGIKFIPNVYFDRHLFQPLLVQGGKLKSTPVGLNKDEKTFIEDLKEFFIQNKESSGLKDKEIYILRNLTRGKGVGFYAAGNFYPDFILWIKDGKKQYINFIDPKGILMLHYLENPKIKLYEILNGIQDDLKETVDDEVILNSFIISNTDSKTIRKEWGRTKKELEENNVLFVEDRDIIARMFRKILFT
ncbi:DEAD/DEAH box helicase family protein [Halanaerobium salsuginis]|uniref:Type III restriction enzyme, res subunit n=1 Tax=Halanaerobium salsuginis TaxID=29563 RepID=A0A1I4K8F5_9FIRM|nr:DEAD/DEAH box helicase family protein [Halanaerobium salsuginis]SFL74970.1 Type III restriction enzyme, res subunit [Halanaerobium salsuginis]